MSMKRSEFAALISRGLSLTPKETWTGPFKDVTGQAPTTRAEMVKIIAYFMQFVIKNTRHHH